MGLHCGQHLVNNSPASPLLLRQREGEEEDAGLRSLGTQSCSIRQGGAGVTFGGDTRGGEREERERGQESRTRGQIWGWRVQRKGKERVTKEE